MVFKRRLSSESWGKRVLTWIVGSYHRCFWFCRWWGGARTCISNKFPGDTHAALSLFSALDWAGLGEKTFLVVTGRSQWERNPESNISFLQQVRMNGNCWSSASVVKSTQNAMNWLKVLQCFQEGLYNSPGRKSSRVSLTSGGAPITWAIQEFWFCNLCASFTTNCSAQGLI